MLPLPPMKIKLLNQRMMADGKISQGAMGRNAAALCAYACKMPARNFPVLFFLLV
jgi:hypothetical protein